MGTTVEFTVPRAERFAVHLSMWAPHVGVLIVLFGLLGLLADAFLPGAVPVVVIFFLYLTARSVLGALRILIDGPIHVVLSVDEDGLDLLIDGEERHRHDWHDLARLVPTRRSDVLWFHDGGVVPIPHGVLDPDTIEALRSHATGIAPRERSLNAKHTEEAPR